MDHTVPSVACVVDDDVDFTGAEVCGFLDQLVDVVVVQHVTGNGNGTASLFLDLLGDLRCFGWERVSC